MCCPEPHLKLILALAFILFLSGMVRAADVNATQSFSSALGAVSGQWYWNIALSLFIGFGLAAIAYMASNALKSAELNTWAKTEFAEMTGTALLVAIILLAIGFSDTVFKAVDWNGDGHADQMTPMQISSTFATDATANMLKAYFRGMQINMIMSLMSGAPKMYFGSESRPQSDVGNTDSDIKKTMAANLPGIPIPIWFLTLYVGSVNYYPYSGTGVFSTNLYAVQSLLITGATMASLLSVAAEFINALALPVLLPLGILMRAFALTRKMGSTVIAVGVCLYFFFPASVLICDKMYSAVPKYDAYKTENPKILGVDIGDTSSITRPFFGPGSYLKQCDGKDPFSFIICLVQQILQWVIDLIMAILAMAKLIIVAAAPGAWIPSLPAFLITQQVSNAVMGDVVTITANYIPHVMSYAVPVLLCPVIIAIICLSAMRSIAPAIGGDAQLLGVSDLI